MSISAALASPTGSSIINFTISRVLPGIATAVLAPELAVPLLVGGGILAAQAAWYYWSEQNRKNIIAKATKNYCTLNPGASACPSQASVLTYQASFFGEVRNRGPYQIGGTPGATSYLYFVSYSTYIDSRNYPPAEQNRIDFKRENGSTLPDNYIPGTISVQPLKPGTAWDKLSQAERDQIISALTDADWRDEIGRMLSGGTLADGQVLNSPSMLLDSGREIPSGSRVLNPADAAVVEAVMDRLKPLQDKVNDLAGVIAAAGLVGVGASVAANTGAINNLGDTVRRASEATNTKVDAMKADMNNNFNKVKKRLSGIASFLNFDRILNVLIWWQTLHNAFMLSADVSRSLVSAFSTVLKALPGDSLLGLPTESEDGSPLDLATTINSSVETWIKGAIGAENYVQMKTTLAEINRIYQSTANGVFLIQGSIQAMHSITEAIGERVGRVGNALKRFGVIGDKAYAHMSENMNTRTAWIDRLQERVGNTQTAISSVEQIAQSVVSIQDNITQLKAQKQQIDTSLQKLDIVEAPDNEATKARSDAENTVSKTPNIDRVDTIRPSELAV